MKETEIVYADRETDFAKIKFFCGKGGVGKTTCAASYGVHLAADRGYKTLIVSTDPAHSLADSLDMSLKKGQVSAVIGCDNLWALELDTTEAVEDFREAISKLTSINQTVDKELRDWASRLGLEEFRDILDNIPPGADEFIALTKVFIPSETMSCGNQFDYIVIDTAPTGHTIRLLAFPMFLDRFLSKALKLRTKLDNALNRLNNMWSLMGTSSSMNKQTLSEAVRRIATFQEQMQAVNRKLRDPNNTDFLLVTIPSRLALEESTRLMQHLKMQHFPIQALIVNQLIDDKSASSYWEHIIRGQERILEKFKENIQEKPIVEIPYLGADMAGRQGIHVLMKLIEDELHNKKTLAMHPFFQFPNKGNTISNMENCQFLLVGGKGGVGKTSSSSAIGSYLAKEGYKVLIVSTDPAHSLGDAWEFKLSGKKEMNVLAHLHSFWLMKDNLFAMEISPEESIEEFRRLLRDLTTDGVGGWGGEVVRNLGLVDFIDILDNPPPGTDELVALTKVIALVENNEYDRVIIDTAPTGHTLRLLSFPEFIDRLLSRVLALKKRLDSTIGLLTSFFRRPDANDSIKNAVERVELFRSRMETLRHVLHDKQKTCFCIVSIPTELSYQESMRLLNSLSQVGVTILAIVINQIVSKHMKETVRKEIVELQSIYWKALKQRLKMEMLLATEKELPIVSMPFFDMEVRGLSALRIFSKLLISSLKEHEKAMDLLE
eukprot:jgi/Galph1/3272/GphlegSOOS_G1904.1